MADQGPTDQKPMEKPMEATGPARLGVADWIAGARPATLLMSLASVGSGAAVALWFSRSCALSPSCAASSAFVSSPEVLSGRWWALALLALFVAVFLQLAANYVDDAADGVAGRDATRPAGAPRRLVARGADPKKVFMTGLICTAIAVVLGVIACAIAGGSRWWLLLIGALCTCAAWAYSAGPHPLSSSGWAPVAIVAAFGLAGVLGTQFLLAGAISLSGIIAALAQGSACAAVLFVNDIRDSKDDDLHGKRTLAVRLGDASTAAFLVLAWIGPILLLIQALMMQAWWALIAVALALVPAIGNPVRRALAHGKDQRGWTLALRMMCAVPPILMIGLWLIAARA